MAMLHILTIVFLFIIRTHFPKTKSLIDVIRICYGNNVVNCLRKINADIDFLNSCLENELCPTFLHFKMSSNRLQNSETYQRSTRLFLHEEIAFKTESEKIIREMQKLKKDLKTVFNFIDWIHVSHKFIENNKKAIKHVQEVHHYKLCELLGDKLQHDPKKSFIIFHHTFYQRMKFLYCLKV